MLCFKCLVVSKIQDQVQNRVLLTIFNLDEVGYLNECTDPILAFSTRVQAFTELSALMANTSENICQMPCKTLNYNLNIIYYHKNIMIDDLLISEK